MLQLLAARASRDSSPQVLARDYAGPMVIGAFETIIVIGFLLNQFVRYWKSNQARKDSVGLRVMVVFTMGITALLAILVCQSAYHYTIEVFGDPVGVVTIHPTQVIAELCVVPMAVTMQAYFALRCLRLTGLWSVTIIVWVLGLGEITFAVILCMRTLMVKTFFDMDVTFAYAAIAILSPIADLLVASTLIWNLHKRRTGLKVTDSILTKIIRFTIETGAVTVLLAIGSFIIGAFGPPNASWPLTIIYPAGPVATFCLMSALNARVEWRKETETYDAHVSGSSTKPFTSTTHQSGLSLDLEAGPVTWQEKTGI